jgi:hypothetical protein
LKTVKNPFFIIEDSNISEVFGISVVCIHKNLLDPLLLASMLEGSKLSGVLGACSLVVWIHEKLKLDPLRLVSIRPINLVHLIHLGNKRNGDSCAQKEAKQRRIWKTYSWPLSGL